MKRSSASPVKTKSLKRAAVQVKICGVTNSRDAKLAAENGADALGFNFYTKSPRKIGVSRARNIVRQLPHEVSAVGVFVDAPARDVMKFARTVKLQAIQLHGNESPATVARIARHFPVIKAFRVGPSFDMKQLKRYSAASAFLLDGYDHQLRGGTGKTFDWTVAGSRRQSVPLILAGGLTRQNVRRAIHAASPCAVDVCSGIEHSPGRKDPRKMQELLKVLGKRSRKTR